MPVLRSIQHMRSLLQAGSNQLSILLPPNPAEGFWVPSASSGLGGSYEGSISSSVASLGGKWSARGCHSVRIIKDSMVPSVLRLPRRRPLQGAVLELSISSDPEPQKPPPNAS